jgi:hypothetical protein
MLWTFEQIVDIKPQGSVCEIKIYNCDPSSILLQILLGKCSVIRTFEIVCHAGEL